MKVKIIIEINDLIDLVHFSRRYCHGRHTYAPGRFNEIYDNLLKDYPALITAENRDETIPTFPKAEVPVYDMAEYLDKGGF